MTISNFISLPDDIEVEVHTVERPPTWRKEAYVLTYLLVNRDIDSIELVRILRWAITSKFLNPRVIPPTSRLWLSLFHPRLFRSINKYSSVQTEPLTWAHPSINDDFGAISLLWLQSVLFLSGVTLSASIIQHRFSSGTIGSKLDRLWDAGALSTRGLAKELSSLSLQNQVSNIWDGVHFQETILSKLIHLTMCTLRLLSLHQEQLLSLHSNNSIYK